LERTEKEDSLYELHKKNEQKSDTTESFGLVE